MRKRINTLVLGIIMILSLCGCSNKEATKDNSIGEYKYVTNITCEALDNVKMAEIAWVDIMYLITNDNQIYTLSTDQLYDNETNCKKVDNIEFSMFYSNSGNNTIVDSDGYQHNYYNGNVVLNKTKLKGYENYKNNHIIKSYVTSDETIMLSSEDGIIYKGNKNINDIFKQIDNEKIKNFYSYSNKGNIDLNYIITDKSFLTNTNIDEYEKNEEISNHINDYALIMPWMLIKNNGDVFINSEIKKEYYGY